MCQDDILACSWCETPKIRALLREIARLHVENERAWDNAKDRLGEVSELKQENRALWNERGALVGHKCTARCEKCATLDLGCPPGRCVMGDHDEHFCRMHAPVF